MEHSPSGIATVVARLIIKPHHVKPGTTRTFTCVGRSGVKIVKASSKSCLTMKAWLRRLIFPQFSLLYSNCSLQSWIQANPHCSEWLDVNSCRKWENQNLWILRKPLWIHWIERHVALQGDRQGRSVLDQRFWKINHWTRTKVSDIAFVSYRKLISLFSTDTRFSVLANFWFLTFSSRIWAPTSA